MNEENRRIRESLGEIAKTDFMAFVILFWKEAKGKGEFKPLWHVEALAEHLEALRNREILKLGVSIQPGLGKSILCSVLFPVWCWLQDPTEQFITATYGEGLRTRDALRSRDIINSEKFQELYGDSIEIRKDQKAVTRYSNTKGGYRIATTVRGGGTGERADCQTPYTKIHTNKGNIEIKELFDIFFFQPDCEIKILTYNFKTKKNEWLLPRAVLRKDLKEDNSFLMRIKFYDNFSTDCTNNHKWYSLTRNKFIETQHLQQNEKIKTSNGELSIDKIEQLKNNIDFVYTLSIPPNGNYYVSLNQNVNILSLNSIIIDDPHKAQERSRPKDLQLVRDWYDTTITNRYNDPKTFMQLIIHQRICEDDLMGHIKNQDSEFVHLRLPNEYDGNKVVTKIGWSDPRKKIGELIAPELFDKNDALEEKRKGSLYYECQYQQNATLKEGNKVNRSDFNFYDVAPSLDKFNSLYSSWDLGEGDPDNENNEKLSFTVGLVWGVIGQSLFLLHMERGTWVFNKQLEKFKFVQKNIYKNQIRNHLIEKKSNGGAVSNLLSTYYGVNNIIEINPKDYGIDKENRFDMCLPTIKSKNVYLPNPKHYDWGDTVLNEILKFPTGKKDDIVDSTSQFINWANQNKINGTIREIIEPEKNRVINPLDYFELFNNNSSSSKELMTVQDLFNLD